MAIKTEVGEVETPKKETYPKLRKWKGERGASYDVLGPLVVLFRTVDQGVALSGVPPERIGKEETWAGANSMDWEKTSITISSVN